MRPLRHGLSPPGIDAIIERSVRDEATAIEVAQLAAWRRASRENERRYRRTIRMLAALPVLDRPATTERPAPPAAALLSQARPTRQ